MDVVSRIIGLEYLFATGISIDRACLGGAAQIQAANVEIKRYWAGATESSNAGRVRKFLEDFDESCAALAKVLKPGGVATLVVGRRTVGGFRVKLDDFVIDQLEGRGFSLLDVSKRRLRNKRLPTHINRFAGSASHDKKVQGSTKTMGEEIVISMRLCGKIS